MSLFAKYDKDRSGSLHEGELKALLEEHIKDKPGFESHIVSDQEVRCVRTCRCRWRAPPTVRADGPLVTRRAPQLRSGYRRFARRRRS